MMMMNNRNFKVHLMGPRGRRLQESTKIAPKERYVTPPGNKGTLKEAQDGIMKMILFAYLEAAIHHHH